MFKFFERKAMRKQAEKDLVAKLRLEKTFKPELKSLFSRMTKDFRVNVAATGIAPDASEYTSAWQDLLRKHYNRTQNTFLGNVQKQIDQELTPDQNDFLLLALLDYRTKRASSQEAFITRTNNTNMFLSLQEARQSLEELQADVSNRSLGTVAAAILARKQKGRVEGIATLETQAAAESTKLFEARSLSGMAPSPDVVPIDQVFRPTQARLNKTWQTVGDKIVRATHKSANGQTKLLDEPYIVGGQSLQYPGDNSLGATIEETINCRCSSTIRGN